MSRSPLRHGVAAYATIKRHPIAAGSLGALTIAFSGILFRWSEATPETAAFFRCAYALPFLWALAHFETVQPNATPLRQRALSYAAGVLFAVDLIFWHRSIEAVGAGLGTVLANLQVVFVVLLAWLLAKERPTSRVLVALPLALMGAVLISGVLEVNAYGRDPGLGVIYGFVTAASYAGFLLLLRRRGQVDVRPATALFDATLSAAVFLALVGAVTGSVDPAPTWPAHGWLLALALESQVLGWLLITIALPLLPAALTSVTLLLQPVAAVVFAGLLLSESPSLLQMVGAGLVLVGVAAVHVRRRRAGALRPERA